GACEVVDLVDPTIDLYRCANVVLDQLKARMVLHLRKVGPRSGQEAVEADHAIAAIDQGIAQMRTEKARTTCDQGGLLAGVADGSTIHGRHVFLIEGGASRSQP